MARNLGIAQQTASNIAINGRDQKIDAKTIDYLVGKIEVKPTSTVKELQEQMRVDLPNKPTVTTESSAKTSMDFFS